MRSLSGASLALVAMLTLGSFAAGCGQVNVIKARKAFKTANQNYQSQDYKKAAEAYEEAIAADPHPAMSIASNAAHVADVGKPPDRSVRLDMRQRQIGAANPHGTSIACGDGQLRLSGKRQGHARQSGPTKLVKTGVTGGPDFSFTSDGQSPDHIRAEPVPACELIARRLGDNAASLPMLALNAREAVRRHDPERAVMPECKIAEGRRRGSSDLN